MYIHLVVIFSQNPRELMADIVESQIGDVSDDQKILFQQYLVYLKRTLN